MAFRGREGASASQVWLAELPGGLPVGALIAQTSGTIEGIIVDARELAVHGARVTLAGEALIAPVVAISLVDGSYRFRTVGRRSYELAFELPNFRTTIREGVIAKGNRVIRIDALMEPALVAETITVAGDAPVVDTRTSVLVNNFGLMELHEVPSATDVWSVLGQTPEVRMRGFDGGGSHEPAD